MIALIRNPNVFSVCSTPERILRDSQTRRDINSTLPRSDMEGRLAVFLVTDFW